MKKLLVFGLSLLLSSTALEAKASYDNLDHADIAFVSEVLLSFISAGKAPHSLTSHRAGSSPSVLVTAT